jgi:hypothetical protein
MQRLFFYIGEQPFSQPFYLAGGTALSLQIGHRRSVGFDFFSATDEVDKKSRNEIIANPANPFVPADEHSTLYPAPASAHKLPRLLAKWRWKPAFTR